MISRSASDSGRCVQPLQLIAGVATAHIHLAVSRNDQVRVSHSEVAPAKHPDLSKQRPRLRTHRCRSNAPSYHPPKDRRLQFSSSAVLPSLFDHSYGPLP